MKINEGMYVRTKEGLIDKVIIDYKGCCNNPNCNCKHVSCEHNYYDEENIIKASDNLIDLIEVGDYVNGLLVTRIYFDEEANKKYLNLYGSVSEWEEEDIKTILTKEQYENNCYKVDDK